MGESNDQMVDQGPTQTQGQAEEDQHQAEIQTPGTYVMGIDQSFTSCGVVVLDEKSGVVRAKIIKSDKTKTDFERSWTIFKEIYALAQECNVKTIAIEGLAFGKFGNATRSLAILQGVLVTNLLYLKMLDGKENRTTKVEIITPSRLKKFATNNGKATKKEMISAVPGDLALEWKKVWKSKGVEDLADAYFLAKILIDIGS